MRATRLSRLLVLLPSTRPGGTERHAAELATRLAKLRGLSVSFAAEPVLHDTLRRWLPPAVTLHPASIGKDETLGAELVTARQAAETERLLAGLRPDLALLPLPWPDAGLGVMRALAAARLPRIVQFHLVADGPPPPAVAPEIPGLDLPRTVLTAVSAPLARRAARIFGVAEHRVVVLPNPAPPPATMERSLARATLRSALGLRADAPLILFVGRLEEAKGADLLPAISDRLPMTLACAGDGPLRGLLESRAAGDPRGLLRVLGPVADPAPWYLAADALLLPSRLEGAPLVFLEAAANRCPVIATAAALEALGPEGATLARLVPQPDPVALAEAAQAALADPADTSKIVEAAAAHATRQSWDRSLDSWLGLLRAAPIMATLEEERAA